MIIDDIIIFFLKCQNNQICCKIEKINLLKPLNGVKLFLSGSKLFIDSENLSDYFLEKHVMSQVLK